MEPSSLAVFWYVFLVFAFLMYVVLDGFDLGAGLMVLLRPDPKFRSQAMLGIAGVWHANQTWLVVFGATLFGAFPLAYGVALSALYLPVGLLLIGLVMRGVALEYYEYARDSVRIGQIFGLGSLVATMAQGLGVGALLVGLPAAHGHYGGGIFGWLSPFSVLLGLGLPVVYYLFGATRLAGKTDGDTRAFCLRTGRTAAGLTLAAAVVVALWGRTAGHTWAQAWTSAPGMTLGPIVLGALAFIPLFLAFRRGRGTFGWAVLAVGLVGVGIAGGLFPLLVPPDVTVTMAAAPPQVHRFMLAGLAIVAPLILVYTIYMYRVFRGPVDEGEPAGE